MMSITSLGGGARQAPLPLAEALAGWLAAEFRSAIFVPWHSTVEICLPIYGPTNGDGELGDCQLHHVGRLLLNSAVGQVTGTYQNKKGTRYFLDYELADPECFAEIRRFVSDRLSGADP